MHYDNVTLVLIFDTTKNNKNNNKNIKKTQVNKKKKLRIRESL